MKTVFVNGFDVKGLVLTTNYHDEMNPQTAQIPLHVKLVDESLDVDYQSGARAYSVYFNYGSDLNSHFDILMGSNQVSSSTIVLSAVHVKRGYYLKFESQGEFPEAIVAAWRSINAYFNSDTCEHTRTYTTDFEYYEGPKAVCVYIAIESKGHH